MTSANTIRAGKATVEVAAELDPLRKGLGAVKGEMRSFGQSLSGIGSGVSALWSTIASSAAVGALVSTVKTFADVGSQLNDMSLRTGVAATELQFLTFAAKQTGASAEDLEIALKAMVRAGLKVEDFQSLGQQIASIQDPTQRTARALEAFGKSGTSLLPMFMQLNDLRKQSAALGPLLSEEDVAAADKLGDSIGALSESFSRLRQQVGAGMAPAALELTQLLIGINAEMAELAKANRGGGGGSDPNRWKGIFPQVNEWVDRMVSRGAEATSQASKMQAQQQAVTDTLKQQAAAQKQLAEVEKARKKQWEDLAKSLNEASKRRLELVREFETPAEAASRKFQEINKAILEVKKSLIFIGQTNVDQQVATLQEAGRRFQRQEAEKQGKEFEKIGKELEGTVEILRQSVKGTTSSAGAALLGRSAEARGETEKKSLDELKKANDHLRKISDRVGPARFS